MVTVTDELVRWARETAADDLPPEALARAADAVTDCVGCILAGSLEPLAPMLRAAGAEPALYFGTLAHALDYDDTNHPGYAHPSAVLVPVLLALADRGVTGREALAAYVLGLEVFGKLGRALNTAHYRRGWHATGTFGTVAAAVVAGALLGLDETRFRHALGIAASAAAGLRVSFGTMTKPLHAGYAARSGLLAARLAEQGVTAGADALGHRYGYLAAFAGDVEPDPAPLRSWGTPLEILTPYGLALKPYPSCGATHPGIEAALGLAEDPALRPARIARVRVGVSEFAFEPLIYDRPATPLEGKFSMHFCVAAALARREVTLRTFAPSVVGDPEVRSLMERVAMEADDRVRHDPEFATVVAVTTSDGATREALVPLARGKPARWMSETGIAAKFRDCASGALDAGARDRLYERLRGLATLPDLREVAHLVSTGARHDG